MASTKWFVHSLIGNKEHFATKTAAIARAHDLAQHTFRSAIVTKCGEEICITRPSIGVCQEHESCLAVYCPLCSDWHHRASA